MLFYASRLGTADPRATPFPRTARATSSRAPHSYRLPAAVKAQKMKLWKSLEPSSSRLNWFRHAAAQAGSHLLAKGIQGP